MSLSSVLLMKAPDAVFIYLHREGMFWKADERSAYFLTSSMRHPNYNSLIDNLKKRLDGEVFLGKK